jgi:hypothetical protein
LSHDIISYHTEPLGDPARNATSSLHILVSHGITHTRNVNTTDFMYPRDYSTVQVFIMVTLRTPPPQRAGKSPDPFNKDAPPFDDIASESAIFKPRNQVLRTPPGGFTTLPVDPPRNDVEDVRMDLDLPENVTHESLQHGISTSIPPVPATPAQPSITPISTTPSIPPLQNPSIPTPTPHHSDDPAIFSQPSEPLQRLNQASSSTSAVLQPTPRTPRSIRKPPSSNLPHPELPLLVPEMDMQEDISIQEYGIRYKHLSQALDNALKASCSKWRSVNLIFTSPQQRSFTTV